MGVRMQEILQRVKAPSGGDVLDRAVGHDVREKKNLCWPRLPPVT
jgi:hypothetical protein